MDWSKQVVAITGASSGIGEATARLVAEQGAKVALLARRKERLDRLAADCKRLGAPAVVAFAGDVSRLQDLQRFAAECKQKLGPVTALVANAGYGQIGNSLDIEPRVVEEIFRVNTVGAIWTVQVFGDQLEATGGHVVVVGSVVSKIAVPYSSLYAGTKWALRGWTRGARAELEDRGITMTLLNPGYVRTEFFQHREMPPGVEQWNPGRGMTSKQVGKRVLRAIRRRPAEMEMTWISRLGIPVYRLMPIQVPRIIAKRIRNRADARYTSGAKKERR